MRFWRFERNPASACNCWYYTSYHLRAGAPNPTLSAKHILNNTGRPVYLAERGLSHIADIRELASSLPAHSLTRIRLAMANICRSSAIS